MEMKVTLDDAKVREAVSEAVMRSLDENARSTLIEGAIAHLLTPATEGWQKGTSPLQHLFNRTIEEVAKVELDKLLADEGNPISARVQALYEEASKKLFDDEDTRGKLVESVKSAMRKAISGNGY